VTTLYREGDRERLIQLKNAGDIRSSFRRDYTRMLHSPAFRRLQGKTQLFPVIESDYFRNRLTHSLEVAQVAKAIAANLNATCEPFNQSDNLRIDPDLVETVSLAHDLGHPPFGHNGEEALDECMRNDGGFEGNAQTLRILARLEKRETEKGGSGGRALISKGNDDRRVGLNLTCRTLAGVLKYDVEIAGDSESRPQGKQTSPMKGYYSTEAKLVEIIHDKVGYDKTQLRKDFKNFRTIECSIMDIADDNVIFYAITMSSRMRVVAYQGKQIVMEIFKALDGTAGSRLMPEDFVSIYDGFTGHSPKKRVICDFIAGMTDRYAIQFHDRLYSTDPASIYSPL
jgi:dGTPase